MASKAISINRVSEQLNRQAANLHKAPRTVIGRFTEDRSQRERRQELLELVKEKAVTIRQEESQEAASACKLNAEFVFQMETDKAVSAHREEMTHKEVQAREAMMETALKILEGKRKQMQAATNLPCDPDVLAEALSHIESIHTAAAQGAIDRNTDQRAK